MPRLSANPFVALYDNAADTQAPLLSDQEVVDQRAILKMSPRLAEIEDQAMKLKLMNYSAGRIGNESLGHHDRLKAEELNITIQVPDSRTLVGSAIINRIKLEPKAKRMLSDLNSANPALR